MSCFCNSFFIIVLLFSFFFFADDHSRVILSPMENEAESHYINANYVDVSSHRLLHMWGIYLLNFTSLDS